MKLPNFLIIGVQKAGTSSIYGYLRQHPQVYMSPIKETNFWTNISKDSQLNETSSQHKRITTFEQYTQLFEGVQDEIAIGEASPNYLFHYQSSLELIHQHLPNAKLIAIIRDPSERAYSDYLMHIRDAKYGGKTLVEQLKTSSQTSYTLLKGLYYQPLKHFIDKFGSEQVKVYLYEDLCQAPIQFMQGMYEFLGVDPTFYPDMSYKAQQGKLPKNQAVNNLLRTDNPIRTAAANTLKMFLPLEIRQNIRNQLLEVNSIDKKQVPLSAEDRKLLVNYYRDDILKLQDLINRDLSAWLKY
ncbi:sulfotransferase [Chroococcus sp. FPU101]|uniref:sulfotransferase family protein n=1 Tax=Chroococcus sp. FPU101 TaxID=1974212 RepID=UPI001A909C77|nr:sulfotransferase [Chroococcus sp. FPU101]GFE67615.1 sulfotransferase [Chroococcus sp. FPU101]